MNAPDLATIRALRGGSYQLRVDYDASGNAIYVGTAPKGKADSDSAWIITKNTYDGSNQLTLAQTSNDDVKWTERTTETYS